MSAVAEGIASNEDLAKLRDSLTAYIDEVQRSVGRLVGWRGQVEQDDAFGRIMAGPQWIAGLSMKDGTITGDKFAANVVVSNLFTTRDPTGPSPTGDRWELDSTSFRAYGTVSAVANTKTFELKSTGDVTIGTGSNQLTYVASTGTLSVPAATITSLTIDKIGAGTQGAVFTLGAGAKIIDSDGSFWDQNGITLATTGSQADALLVRRTAFTAGLSLRGAIGAGTATFNLNSSSDPSTPTVDGVQLNMGASSGGTSSGGLSVFDGSGQQTGLVLAVGGITFPINSTTMGRINSTGFYVGNQTTRYMADNGSQILLNGALKVNGTIFPNSQTTIGITTSGSYLQATGGGIDLSNNSPKMFVVGASGAMPAATHAIVITDGTTTYYIPGYSANSNWAA